MAKKPRIAADLEVAKRPIREVPDPDDVIKHHPVSWGFRFLDMGGDWGWKKLDPRYADQLHQELLRKVEGKKLHDLLHQKIIKKIPVDHMEPEAQERLRNTGFEEAEELYEIRLQNKWHVWGLVERAEFGLLWWDPDETACGHPPKRVKRG